MRRRSTLPLAILVCAVGVGGLPPSAASQDVEATGFERTPPRLSLVDGEVSFLRSGAPDWTPARVNTPLAPGDELYAADDANLELQVGPRAFVRADADTQLGLVNLEPDYLQLRVTTGNVSLDLRSLTASTTFELSTPNAAFVIERTGYYRVEVHGDSTSFTTRRGGRAVVTPAAGESVSIEPSEQVVVTGLETPTVASYAAPEPDDWDRWNYARTDDLLDAASARYVSPGIYGVADLDPYGDWRLVPTYGAVWVPRAVPVGWVPYSTGVWLYDPFYGWTWVDDAPWGWAPYHYGRWVLVGGYWGWAPGPIVVRPYYAPALVAFFSGGGISVGITFGAPSIGWVALGWGEPLLPWWGPIGFRGRPHWARWGGPRIVNQGVVKRTVVVRAREIHRYEHTHHHGALVAMRRDHFGHRAGEPARFTRGEPSRFDLVRGELPVAPRPSSLAPARGAAPRPPFEIARRPVVATRRPAVTRIPELETRPSRGEEALRREAPPVRLVEPRREARRSVVPERAPFGRDGAGEREAPPPAPRFESARRRTAPPGGAAQPEPGRPSPPRGVAEPRARSAPSAPEARPRERGGVARPAPAGRVDRREPGASGRSRELPGEPANRVWRERSPATPRPQAQPTAPRPRPGEIRAPSGARSQPRAGRGDAMRGQR